MKKLLLLIAMVAMCILVTSCEEKKVVMLGDCELTEANGKFGLRFEGLTILSNDFTEIKLDEQAHVYLATREGGLVSFVDAKTHSTLFSDYIEGISPANTPDFFYVKTADNKTYLVKGSTTWGPFETIILQDNYVFMQDNGKWGVASISPRVGLAPRNYVKIYIVKNKSTFAVLVNDGEAWKMFDDDGVTNGAAYDLSSKILEREIGKITLPEASIGVLDVAWDL